MFSQCCQNLVNEGEPHIWIERPYSHMFYPPQTHFRSPMPTELKTSTNKDSIIETKWNIFATELDVHVFQLNTGLRRSTIILFCLALFLMTMSIGSKWTDVSDPLRRYITAAGALFISVSYYVIYFRTTKRNHKVDEEISSLCRRQSFTSNFQSMTGYGIEYRTAHTGFCKSRHARPARVLVFVRMSDHADDGVEILQQNLLGLGV